MANIFPLESILKKVELLPLEMSMMSVELHHKKQERLQV